MAADAVTATRAVYQCKTCERELSADSFYASNQTRCKECVRKSVRENRANKAEYYRKYDRTRYQNDPRVKQRHKRYAATDAGKEASQRARDKWQDDNAEKRAAHIALGNAVRDGKVEKKCQCRLCGVTGETMDAHHFDYSKPLDVTWLCRQCHVTFHKHHGPIVKGKLT